MLFAESIADPEIVSALRRELSWTHIKTLIYIDDPLKRDFYRQMAVGEGWSTRTLDERIGSLLFERTAISKQPEQTIRVELDLLRDQGRVNQILLLKADYCSTFSTGVTVIWKRSLKVRNACVYLCQFKPEHPLNPERLVRYQQNICRMVHLRNMGPLD